MPTVGGRLRLARAASSMTNAEAHHEASAPGIPGTGSRSRRLGGFEGVRTVYVVEADDLAVLTCRPNYWQLTVFRAQPLKSSPPSAPALRRIVRGTTPRGENGLPVLAETAKRIAYGDAAPDDRGAAD